MNFEKEFISFNNKIDQEIKCDIRIPAGDDKSPVVLFLHGFKSFRNWGFIPYFCDKLAENGFISINVDHAFNGILDSENIIFDEEKFRKQTVTQYFVDIQETCQSIQNGLINDKIREKFNGDIYLIGHSLGGSIAFFVAKNNPIIKKIVTLATISRIHRNSNRHIGMWKELGYTDIKIARTNQTLKLDYSYAEDKDSYAESCILDILPNLNQEILLLHGALDLTVKKSECFELYEHSNKNKTEYKIIEKTAHTFGCDHPFKSETKALGEAILETINFLKR